MDTGLGNKAYSIIGQGQIGNIIEQRPEETRIMLEEAAGITKYRRKVVISQKKIELTETNLQRVGDILSEIEKQIRSGRKNNNRFIMSIGSPVTPGTSVDRVKQYVDMSRRLGARRAKKEF